jgi:glc operon protein GlcG
MLVIRIGPRMLALLGMAAALAVGLVIGSLRPTEMVSAATRGSGPADAVLAGPAAQSAGITYDQAVRMIQAAMADARSKNYNMTFMTFTVLDAGGHVIASRRMDGARLNTVGFSHGKAYASVLTGRSSGSVQESYANNPALWGNAATLGNGVPMLPARGAMPITINGALVGAMGASGGPSEQDEAAVVAGIAAVGLQ